MTKLGLFFRSIKLAVVLILIISAISLVGVFLPQIPYDFSVSPEGTAWWINNVAYAQFGGLTGIFSALGFFDIFHSVWFIGASTLLLLNILVCSLSRYQKLRFAWSRAAARTDVEFYAKGKFNAEFELDVPIGEAVARTEETLKKMRYSIAEKKQDAGTYVAGNKNRFSAFGTYFVHLSLFVFLIGVVLGFSAGFKNNSFIVFEGTARDVGYGTGLSLYLESFEDEYWADGTPKDYRSEAAVYKNGAEIKSGVIRVNHPMEAEGIRFHQSFFGQAVQIEANGPDGAQYDGPVALSGVSRDGDHERPQGSVQMEGSGDIVVVTGRATGGEDPTFAADEVGAEVYDADFNFLGWATLAKGDSKEVGGLTISYKNDLAYSGFLVSRDPGTGLIWTASVLFLLGLAMIFYLPDRRVWAALRETEGKRTRALLRLRSTKGFGLDAEMQKMIAELKGDGQADEF